MRESGKVGVLLLQLGTPDAPTTPAVRRYLREFLSDRRVVDLPRPLWLPILHLRVLPTRPARSAALYQKVWSLEGSPLATITKAQAELLSARLDEAFPGSVTVAFAMRYGTPSIASVVDRCLREGCDRFLVFPMYPQYAGATTGSTLEAVFRLLAPRRVIPAIRIVPPYFEDPSYIDALAASTRTSLAGTAVEHVLLSFHGLPARYATAGDPYPEQCAATARALSRAMGWSSMPVNVSFQSRFGREEWLRPYTDETLRGLAALKVGRLAALCPGFTADCLETLEEMGITNAELYHQAGGGEYRVLPCLNTHPRWIEAMADIATRELQGWL